MNYHNITHEDMNNGDGLRTVLWLSGCSHHCEGCQNSQTWDPNSGIEFDEDAKEELFESLAPSWISGITFTGGDPLYEANRDTVESLIKEFRTKFGDTKTIWLYTGYTWDEVKDLPYIKEVDVLVDGSFILKERDVNLKWKGSPNQKVIDVKKTLQAGKIILHCE